MSREEWEFRGLSGDVDTFIRGWMAAKGGDLFITEIVIGSGAAARSGAILWKDDPAEMLEKNGG